MPAPRDPHAGARLRAGARRLTVDLRFLGTGTTSAPAGRAQSCIVLGDGETTLLLDCGATALPAIVRAIDPTTIDGVVVTHLHGDHFGGLPFLHMHQKFARRTRELVIAGPPSLEERLRTLNAALYADFYAEPLGFAVRFAPLDSGDIAIGGASVTGMRVAHTPSADPFGVRVRIGGKTIGYTGDAEWTDAIPALADGADLFITEATTFSSRWPGHLSVEELAARRGELRATRIVLTHLGPETAERRELPFEAAEDGTAITL